MIRRAPHRKHWVTVDNRTVEDSRLSLRAKGLLFYILSRPDNWCAHPAQLATTTSDSIGIVRACLRELSKFGYAKLTRLGSGGRGKLLGTEWLVDELVEIPVLRDSTLSSFVNGQPLTKTEKITTTEKKNRFAILPISLFGIDNDWAEWLQHRKELKKPMTPSTFKKQIDKLDRMGVARAKVAIQHSIESGYTGIFEPAAQRGTVTLDLRGKTLDQLDKMRRERHGKLVLLRRQYGDGASETGAVGKQFKTLQAELVEIHAASKIELDKLIEGTREEQK